MVGPLGGSPVAARHRPVRHNTAKREALTSVKRYCQKITSLPLDSSMFGPGHCFRSRGLTSPWHCFTRFNRWPGRLEPGSQPPEIAMTVMAG